MGLKQGSPGEVVGDEEMNEANEKCVDYIIKPQKIMIAGRVDLHGLHLKEAEQVVIDFLDHHVDKKIFQKVEIITGAGHHSIRKEHPVIRPMVLELLEARGLKYHAEHGNGAFLIDIVVHNLNDAIILEDAVYPSFLHISLHLH